jgi:TonB-linked SusC/RagA family outer membrane protein
MKQILTIFLVMMSMVVFSQEKTITGKLTNEAGTALLGATISIKGQRKGTISDFDGNYSLKTKVGDVLVFASLGSDTKRITVGSTNVIDVVLKKSESQLDEVVVVGYGTVKKSDLTGSVSSIKAEDIVKSGSVGLEQAIAGRAAGVVVTSGSGEPGAGASIRIRGVSSLNGSEPLYIIDGVAMDNSSEGGLGSQDVESSSLSPLSMINPSDIESMEILKDASSTAIYGSRGANGVVLITTKSGEPGKGIITFEQDYGITKIPHVIDVLKSNDFVILDAEADRNAGNLPRRQSRLDSARVGLLQNNDWQRTIIQTGTSSNTNLSFRGGNKDLRYKISNNYLDVKGIIKNTNYKRASTRVNVDADLSDKFKVGVRLNYSHVTSDQRSISTGTNNLRGATSAIRRALRASPTTGFLADDEDEGIELWTPKTSLEANHYNNLLTQFVGSLDAEYNFTKALSFKTQFTHQNRNTAQRYYQFNILPRNVAEGGRARTGDSRRTKSSLTNTLNFKEKFGDHRINAVLGQEIESSERESINVSNYGFANDLLTYYDPGSAAFNDPDQISYSKDNLASFFGRINYNFKGKYLLTLTGRYDGASKFAANKKWAFFPAAAIAYKLSEENFIRDINAISELKLRLSYGSSGNQSIRTYESLDQYASDQTPFNEALTTVYYASQLPNPDLTWETTTQLDAGLDFGLFNSRITGTLDYYNKITDDLLFRENKIPVQSGFPVYTQNFGSLETEGYEASFSARIFSNKNFTWTLSGNVATGKTKVTALGSDYLFSGWNPGFISGGTARLIIGEEIGTFYGYQRAGIAQFDDFVEFQGLSNQERIDIYNADPTARYTFVEGYTGGVPYVDTDTRPGEQLYEDVTPDGSINENDRTIIGHAQPDLTFGISNSFSLGNLDLSIFIDSQIGQELANIQNTSLLTFDGSQSLAKTLNRWTPEKPSTIWPRQDQTNTRGVPFSDRYLEDASFVRVQNITLGYNFPKDIVKKLNINRLRVYVAVSNVHIWTDYSGYTPDVSIRGSDVTRMGHDNAGYPDGRTFRMGVNLKL